MVKIDDKETIICDNCIHAHCCKAYYDHLKYGSDVYDDCEDFLNEQKAVWKPVALLSDPPKTRWKCSLCGWADFRIEYKMRYCPNCGSYMRRDDNGQD